MVSFLFPLPTTLNRQEETKPTPNAVAGEPSGKTDTTADTKSNNPVLWVWWLAFGIWPLAALFLSAGSLVGSFSDTSAEAVAENLLDTNQTITLIGSFVGLIAAIAWILFVRQLTTRHRSLTNEN